MTVAISTGALAGGDVGNGVTGFFGVPYAAAPLGENRFRMPQPATPWDGVRPASLHAPAAWQSAVPSPRHLVDLGVAAESEDCLTVAVWTPAPDPQAKLPVLVFIHGGAFLTGSGSLAAYDGAALAARGTVVVTVNYRLGMFGWLRAPELGATGNEGLADQAAALAWVQAEIAAFGGDPANVTVFGESAGAASIAAHLAAGRGGSLFRRAILQSGAHNLCGSVAAADAAHDRVAEWLAERSIAWSALRTMAPADLVALQQQALPRSAGLSLRPVTDGDLVPTDPAAALAGGAGTGVSVLAGTNRDEMGFFWGRDPGLDTVTDKRLAALVGAWTDRPDEVAAAYRAVRAARGELTDPRSLAMAMGADGMFRRGVIELAEQQTRHGSAHVYLFDWESPLFDGLVGAGHVLELPFVFGTYAHPTCAGYVGPDPAAAALSERMQDAWVRFASSGDPGWPAYDLERRATQRFGVSCPVENDPYGDELRAWTLAGVTA